MRPGIGADHAAGLAQKLIIVRPYLMLAWAGQRTEVDRMIWELDHLLPSEASELGDPEVILRILDTCGENTMLVALVIWDKAVYPFVAHTRGFELDSKRVYLLGSGASDFFEYLQTHPDLLPKQEQAADQIAQAILLRFAARAMALQWIVGTGLDDSWGGGFEVAYPDEDGFRKIGNILFRAWMIDEEGVYSNSGRSFFSRYYGKNLHLSCFNPCEKTYVIRSPICEQSEPPEYEEVHPEWTLDFFVMKKNGAFVEFARFQPPHRPVRDLVQLEKGVLVGWAMDREYVEQCAKKAIAAADKGNHFEITSY